MGRWVCGVKRVCTCTCNVEGLSIANPNTPVKSISPIMSPHTNGDFHIYESVRPSQASLFPAQLRSLTDARLTHSKYADDAERGA